MGKKLFNIITLVVLFFCVVNPIEAIGGRGGGGRGGGGARAGAARAGGAGATRASPATRSRQVANIPSPSMSRADVRTRQSTSMQQRPRQTSWGSNPEALRGQLQQHVQTPGSRTAVNQNLRNSLPQLNRTNAQTASRTLNQFNRQHPNANNLFNSNFYSRQGLTPNFGSNANLWRNAGWANTAAWMGLGAYAGGYPAYYYDESGLSTSLTPQETETYTPQTPQQNIIIMPSQTEQAVTTNQPTSSQTNTADSIATGDWLPLGVFAVGSSAEEAPYSNMVMQLALSKSGYLAGTYYNAATDQAYTMEGMVDKNSQEAIWKMSDNPETPVAWTGIYNLTQDVVPIQVRFPDETSQTKVLVRLQNAS